MVGIPVFEMPHTPPHKVEEKNTLGNVPSNYTNKIGARLTCHLYYILSPLVWECPLPWALYYLYRLLHPIKLNYGLWLLTNIKTFQI